MRRSRSAFLSFSKPSTLILCILILSTLSFAAAPDRITRPIVAGPMVRLATGAPGNARTQFDQGAVDPALKMSYMTLLTVPSASQKRALNKLLAEQQNPHSASYRKWLTPEQCADRFGLSPDDIRKLTEWLQSQGFTIVRTARARNWIAFSGTAAQVERTFQTPIHNYKVDGEMHFANTTAPAIPAALSGIVTGVRGLNNFRLKSQARRAKPGYTFTSSGNNYLFLAPGDIATIYNIPAALDGSGQSIAVIGETGIYQADLKAFRAGFGLSAINCTTDVNDIITACDTPNFKYVLVSGTPQEIYSDLPEADLDIEWSGATARNAQIIYVTANDPSGSGVYDSLYAAINDAVSPVMTMSYTAPCELFEIGFFDADETELQLANTKGITFMNSSGDTGAAECDNFGITGINTAILGYAVAYPASSQYVTAVGGTLIPYTEFNATYWNTGNDANGGSAKSYIPEATWNDSQEFGELCTANPADPFCTFFGITDWASAQSSLGIIAGGGGVSNCVTTSDGTFNGVCLSGFPQPSWQAGLNASAVNPGGIGQIDPNTPTRYSPDVSLLASVYFPGYIVCTEDSCAGGVSNAVSGCVSAVGNCTVFGGTSVSSPVFAGIVALMNQNVGASGLGNINPLLYTLAATPANGAFHPLQTGSIGAFCFPGQPSNQPTALQCPNSGPGAGFLGFDASNFDPTTGYNLATGLGSVDVNNLAIAWAAAVNPDFTVTDTSSNGDTATVLAGVSGVGYSFTVAPVPPATTFAKTVTFSCSGLDATTSCIFNPASLAGTDTTTDVTLTIATSGPNTSSGNVRQRQRADNRLPWLPFTLPLAGVVMVGLAGRKVSKYSPIAGLCLALVLFGLLLACGGRTPISVTAVNPQSVSLWPNNAGWPSSTQTFTATVNNNTGVNWSLSPSGASSGSIDASGNYTAPQVAAGLPPTVTVTATSQQDSTKSNTATITLKAATVPGTFNVTVTVTSATTPPTPHDLSPVLTLNVQ